MKAVYLVVLTILSFESFGQTVSVSGTVKDGHGQAIPFAFVRDARHYSATYTDSLGAYLLKADPSSSLSAYAIGYSDVHVPVGNKTAIDIVMNKGNSSAGTNFKLPAGTPDENAGFLTRQQLSAQTGSSQVAKGGFTQEPTKGSPYLFDEWVHGFAVGTGDSLLYDINNLYNYDKRSGELLFTADKRSVMQVNKAGIKYFCLFNGKLYPFVFENAPAVSRKTFTEVLLSTPSFRIYKQTDTKLQRADFHTDGVIESGHRYDEYVDAVHYFFVKTGAAPKQISLKKKTLKELIGGDADKFIAAQGDREVDENYVRELGYSLAQ